MNATTVAPFEEFFNAVYGYAPYRWQTDLAHRIAAGHAPRNIGVDTGMGKSKVVAAWLWALAADQAERTVPLRLHFVIDRRTVVDQVTVDGEELRAALLASGHPAVASVAGALTRFSDDGFDVITLRGGMPGIPEHTKSIARPTLIVSTLDMFGSRLLGRGYGVSKGRRPIDMALTGMDTLIVLDEVHLAAQMVQTLNDLSTQQHIDEKSVGVPGRTVIEMSATTAPDVTDVLTLDWESEFAVNAALRERRQNRDSVAITVDTDATAVALVKRNLPGPGQAVVIFTNTVKDALKTAGELRKTGVEIVTLVGGTPEPARRQAAKKLTPFMTGAAGRADAPATIVVATQTLEAGADLDFDNGYTDACTLDAFVQRLGRVNRLGHRQGGAMTVVTGPYPADMEKDAAKKNPVYGQAAYATADFLGTTPTVAGLTAAQTTLSLEEKTQLLRPRQEPRRLPRHVFEELTGDVADTLAPAVGPWIRFIEQETARVHVAFRDGLNIDADEDALAEHIASFPVAGWEVWDLTQSAAASKPLDLPKQDERVLYASADGQLAWTEYGYVPHGSVVILPSRKTSAALPLFGSDLTSYRCRDEAPLLIIPAPDDDAAETDITEVTDRHAPGVFNAPGISATLVTRLGDHLVLWAHRLRTRQEKRQRVSLADHSAEVGATARALACAVGLPDDLTEAVEIAGARHDLGKLDPRFQLMLSAVDEGAGFRFDEPAEPLAKSGSSPAHDSAVRLAAAVPTGFRHEALSVTLSDDLGYPATVDRDLVRYLIAAHHGRFRALPPLTADPSAVTIGDREVRNTLQDPTDAEWAGWFDVAHSLERRYGRYTLAYLTAIVRLADWAESARSTK